MKIGFIGTGVMGSGMVRNLLKHGFDVNVYNRTPAKAQALTKEGAVFTETIENCVEDADVVITIVGFPKDVEEVYDKIISHAKKGTVLIDMTTSKPSLAKQIYNKAKQQQMSALDAPVSGGDTGAKNGTLSIMVGGDKDVFEQMKDVFSAMGTTINYIGEAGAGQHCKMSNQIAIAGTIAGDMEAVVYAIKAGLDINTVMAAISKGAAGSNQMSGNCIRAIRGDFDPGFFIKHFIKDMRIAIEETHQLDYALPILEKVCSIYEELQDKGYDDLGTQALYHYYIKS